MSHTAGKTNAFDCVEFKDRAQTRLYEATRKLSADQRREHIRGILETAPLAEFWKRVTQQSRTAPKAGRL